MLPSQQPAAAHCCHAPVGGEFLHLHCSHCPGASAVRRSSFTRFPVILQLVKFLGLIYLTVCDWVKPCGSMPVNPEVVLADWKCSLHFLASWHCPAGYSEVKKCNLA